MLVLNRKNKERIRINDDIIITILQINGGSVKLGIEAPRDVPVYREELYKRIQSEGSNKNGAKEKSKRKSGNSR